jgi:hypothetical protein
MTQTDAAPAPVTTKPCTTSDLAQEFDDYLAYVSLPVLLVMLAFGARFTAIPNLLISPLTPALNAVGLGDAWFTGYLVTAAYVLVTLILTSLASALVAAVVLAVKHILCAVVHAGRR